MQDLASMVVLICAAIAALGLGVILAFAICRVGFAILRAQTRPAELKAMQPEAQVAEV
jgi:hypothetical protein